LKQFKHGHPVTVAVSVVRPYKSVTTQRYWSVVLYVLRHWDCDYLLLADAVLRTSGMRSFICLPSHVRFEDTYSGRNG